MSAMANNTTSVKYNKWDTLASELDTELEESNKADEAAAAAALGHDGAWSADQEKEMRKAEQAKLAKAALDRQKELEESAKLTLTTADLPDAISDEFIKDQKILVFKGIESKDGVQRVCTIDLQTPLIKIFVEHCENLTLKLNVKLMTQHVECHDCKGCTFEIKQTISTIQIDQSLDCTIQYSPGCFEGADDRVYSAGCTNLTINCDHTTFGPSTVAHSYLLDGSAQVNENTKEEYQFVARFSEENKKIINEHLMRVGNKFLTKSTVENANLDEAATLAIREQKKAEVSREHTHTLRAGQVTLNCLIVHAESLYKNRERPCRSPCSSPCRHAPNTLLPTLPLNSYSRLTLPPPPPQAEQHKLEGNDAFLQGEYAQAILFYSMAIDKVQSLANGGGLEHLCLANRSACFLKMGHHEKALADANKCVDIEPTYIKGVFRKGMALHAMGSYEEALPVLGQSLKMEPNNKQVKQALQFCEAKLQMEMRKRMQGSNA